MIDLPASVRVYLCLNPCDMRRSFDGLHALVRDHLESDAFAGHLYLFANKRKILAAQMQQHLVTFYNQNRRKVLTCFATDGCPL